MTFIIDYYVILNTETVYNKQIKVKNKESELVAECALEDFLKRKYKENFKQLVITKCNKEFIDSFWDLFGGFK